MEQVATGLYARGTTLRYQFPFMEKGSKRPDSPTLAHAAARAAVAEAHKRCRGMPLVAGGKSFGGRMTSQAQARRPLAGVRGLVFLGYSSDTSAATRGIRASMPSGRSIVWRRRRWISARRPRTGSPKDGSGSRRATPASSARRRRWTGRTTPIGSGRRRRPRTPTARPATTRRNNSTLGSFPEIGPGPDQILRPGPDLFPAGKFEIPNSRSEKTGDFKDSWFWILRDSNGCDLEGLVRTVDGPNIRSGAGPNIAPGDGPIPASRRGPAAMIAFGSGRLPPVGSPSAPENKFGVQCWHLGQRPKQGFVNNGGHRRRICCPHSVYEVAIILKSKGFP